MTMVMWLVVGIAVAGTIANAYQKWWCFILWIISNIGFTIHNILRGDWPQAVLFFIYTIISCIGLYIWKGKKCQ